jgi:hypothetical protein
LTKAERDEAKRRADEAGGAQFDVVSKDEMARVLGWDTKEVA